VTCRVLKLARQPYDRSLAAPVGAPVCGRPTEGLPGDLAAVGNRFIRGATGLPGGGY